jgi:hypothetical protein
MRIGYDSLYHLNEIPWEPGYLIFAYINGVVSSENYAQALLLYPQAQIGTITTNGDVNAKALICDCETGDYTPQKAAQWVINGSGQTIYASRSTWPIVRRLIPGNIPVDWFATTLDGTTDVPGSVAVQYYDNGYYDTSFITDNNWFPAPQPYPLQHPKRKDMIVTVCLDNNNPPYATNDQYTVEGTVVQQVVNPTAANLLAACGQTAPAPVSSGFLVKRSPAPLAAS